ncbi:MAG: ABC transporter ATP-binding protein [Caldilineaceae bacterium]|nr:ABC transporter ATP-binding protein [Caldilineaceae bacterium]
MRTLMSYAKRYRTLIVLQLIFATIWVASQLLIPRLMVEIIDKGIMLNDMDYIVRIGLLMVATSIVNVVSLLIMLYFLTHVNAGISRDMRGDIFEKVIDWSEQVRQNFSTSTLITRNVNDVKQVSNFVDLALRKIYTLTITIIGSVIIAFMLDVQLALLMLLIVPFVFFLATRLTSHALPQYARIRSSIDNINRLFRQNMSGIRVVKAFGKTEYEEQQFANAVEDAYDANVKAESTMMLLAPLVLLFVNILVLVILAAGGVRAESGLIQIGVLVAIIEYVTLALNNVQQFAAIITVLPRSNVSLKRIGEILSTEETVHFPKESEAAPVWTAGLSGIEIKNLTFYYPGASYPAIDNVSLEIKPGTTSAIIGSTGSGKSTLLRLIMRHYDATSGSILVDGRDSKELSQNEFNRLFTIIPQQTFLFSDSIRQNIRAGKPDATDDEIWRVLDACQMGDFFRGSENKLDTQIAQNAVNLSGGQKQRIALARGLIRDTYYYIFDDCFSALDFSTERKIRHAIQELLANKTLIIVAQRVATVQNSEEILVMDNGVITDRGTHEELLTQSTVYQEIIASQIQEEYV